MNNAVPSISWDEILIDNLVLPSELICYYIYRYRKDLSLKKDNKVDIDLSYIKKYYNELYGGEENE